MSGSCDGQIFVHDLRTKSIGRSPVTTIELGPTSVMSLKFAPGNNRFSACGADGKMRIIGTYGGETWAVVETNTPNHELRCAVTYGNSLVTGDDAGVIKVWDVNTAVHLSTIAGVGGLSGPAVEPLSCICISDDGQYLAAGCDDGSVYIFPGKM